MNFAGNWSCVATRRGAFKHEIADETRDCLTRKWRGAHGAASLMRGRPLILRFCHAAVAGKGGGIGQWATKRASSLSPQTRHSVRLATSINVAKSFYNRALYIEKIGYF